MNDIHQPLDAFLATRDNAYLAELHAIPLFDPQWTATWTRTNQQQFVKLFYHLRGHFHDFLWHLGNYAPDLTHKKIILANISEEFGGHGRSHEQLYDQFARAVGINDLVTDMVEATPSFAFVDTFNRGHLAWLRRHDWTSQLAAFSAYERLDNLDYPGLLQMAHSFALADSDVTFFSVHSKVTHFDATKASLEQRWPQQAPLIQAGFNFIYHHQLTMWRQLSEAMAHYVQ